jgi:site-specific DNA-methyltransferase (adenine-specific)
MTKKYQVIYADPPWRYANKPSANRTSRGFAGNHYGLMTLEEMKKFSLPTDENCALLMWATFPMLKQAIELMEAWGFKYRTVAFTWHKVYKSGKDFWGCGYYTRSNNEVCLLGIKGKIKTKNHGVHQVVSSEIGRHSEKPKEIRDKIVTLLGDLPRIELFAREKTEGWDVFGNEVESDVTL